MNDNYQYNSYQDNNFNNPYERRQNSPLSIASLVLGILSSICCCIGYAGVVFGIVAIVLAILSRRELGRFEAMATVGLVLGIFGAVISVITIISVLLLPEDAFDAYFDAYFEGVAPNL